MLAAAFQLEFISLLVPPPSLPQLTQQGLVMACMAVVKVALLHEFQILNIRSKIQGHPRHCDAIGSHLFLHLRHRTSGTSVPCTPLWCGGIGKSNMIRHAKFNGSSPPLCTRGTAPLPQGHPVKEYVSSLAAG